MTLFERYKKIQNLDDELHGHHVKVIHEGENEIIVRGIDVEYEVGRTSEYAWLERAVLNPITQEITIFHLVAGKSKTVKA